LLGLAPGGKSKRKRQPGSKPSHKIGAKLLEAARSKRRRF
jgi:hypothetical protein